MVHVRSHWLKQALATDTAVAPALAGEERADVVIVGGGFCGLWTALTIKEREPSRDVVVIERDICGGGASGRNAGYVINLWAKFPTLLEMMPSDEAVRVARAAADGVARSRRSARNTPSMPICVGPAGCGARPATARPRASTTRSRRWRATSSRCSSG